MDYYENRRPEGGFREMLLLDIIRDYKPVYPEGADWDETARFIYDEEPEHMAVLKASLDRKGWRQPIRLSTPEDVETDGDAFVLDGTHRVVLAMREGVISVPVVTGDELAPLSDEIESSTDLHIELISGRDLTEDEDFAIFDLFRSLELTEDIWLNSDIGSGHLGSWSFYYAELDDETHHGRLKRVARSRLKSRFPDHQFKVTTILELGEDEESATPK